MIFIILLIAVLVGAVWAFISLWDADMPFFGAFIFLVILVCGVVVSGTVLYSIVSHLPPDRVTETKTELRALGNDSATSGSFFLGTGYVDEELVLNYITRDDEGGNHLESVQAEDAVVYEDTESDAYLLTRTNEVSAPWLLLPTVHRQQGTVEFHVPPNSVDSEYEVSVTD